MKVLKDPLVVAVHRLESMLMSDVDQNPEKGGRIDKALANVEQAIRQHAAMSGPVDEPSVDMDRPLLPSPGLDRRKAGLRNELGGLLRETRRLRNRLLATSPAPILAPEAVCNDGTELDRGGDFKMFFNRVHQLADDLETFGKDEVHFVQDSITTDIGAGD